MSKLMKENISRLNELTYNPKRFSLRKAKEKGAKQIAVISGKGGVGKSNLVANLAFALNDIGLKTLIIDADLGLGNIHILLGLRPNFTIQDLLEGNKEIDEIIIKSKDGLDILPACSGNRKFPDLTRSELMSFSAELDSLKDNYDLILFDLSAGISKNVQYFSSMADEIIVITNSEPTSFADAYAVMKILSTENFKKVFRLVVNSVENEDEARIVHHRLESVAYKFHQDFNIEPLGFLTIDKALPDAVRLQSLFIRRYPDSLISKATMKLAQNLASIIVS